MVKKYTTFEINGAHVGIYPMKEVEAVKMVFEFKAGSRYEAGSKWGAMHLLEHMVHEGTESFPELMDIDNFRERHGISSNAYTGGAAMGFWFRFPAKSFQSAMKLAEEVVFKPTIPEGVLPKEKNVVAQEYRDSWSSPHRRFSRENLKFIFGETHPYTRDGLGQPEYINDLSAEKLRTIHKKFIVPANMYIGVAGKVDPKEVKIEFGKLLKQYARGNKTSPIDRPVKPKKTYLYHKEDVEHAVIILTWLIPGYDDMTPKEEEMLRLAKYLLGGSPLSLLFYELRQKMGIAYSGGASISTQPHKGIFECYTATDFANIHPALEAIQRIVKDFLKNGVPSSRFYQAKKFLDMQLLLSYDSVDGIAGSLVSDLFYFKRVVPLTEHRKTLASVSQKDMLQFINKYLDTKPYISIMAKDEPEGVQ